MGKTKIAISVVVIAVAILFAGNNDLYAGGGAQNPWGIVSPAPSGTTWTGNLVITGQIQDVPGSPASGFTGTQPADPDLYKDQIIKIEFFVRLENKKLGFATFSGLGIDDDGYYLFYAVADYFSLRLGEALNKFLREKVYPKLPGGPYAHGALTAIANDRQNVDTQLSATGQLQLGTLLYYNAQNTVVTY